MKLIIHWRPSSLWGLTLLGLLLRLYGLNWDQGNNFHPDERQILFHVVALGWPRSLAQFFDAANSPLNPHFFAYGSFPLYLLALLGALVVHSSAQPSAFVNLTLLGRALSALFDSGTILLTGLLGLALTRDTTQGRRYAWSVALFAAALVTFTPLQLQLAHFFAVDSMLLFFVMLTLLLCVRLADSEQPLRLLLLVGLSYGLALATKFSSAPLIVPLFFALALRWYRRGDLLANLVFFGFTCALTLLVFLIIEPYALLDRQNFIQQVIEQSDIARGSLDLPYTRQFAGTLPFIYEVQNMLLWGLGVTLGAAAFAGFCWMCWRVWQRDAGSWLIVLFWVIVYGGVNCTFYTKYMRYILPVYPCLTLLGAAAVMALFHHDWQFQRPSMRRLLSALPVCRAVLVALILAGTMFQGLALLNIYSQPNTRVQASLWIYSHLKPGSVLTYEQWDDALPVAIGGHDSSVYMQAATIDSTGQHTIGLDLYGDDTLAKARELAAILPTLDAITMATDRLDKSIPRLPARYPLTVHYYQLLFSGQLGFHLAAQFENHPHLFGITLDDSEADESYSVFDHPHSRIFVRDTPYPYSSGQLFQKLLAGVQLPPAGAFLSGAQQSLLLTPQQIADDQSSPPLAVQFPANSLANTFPVLFWWLALFILGIIAYPLAFPALRGLVDGGYIVSKVLGMLLLAYFAWIAACIHLLPFEHSSTVLVLSVLALAGGVAFFLQRYAIAVFLRQKWRTFLCCEALFCVAYLLFIVIRAFNPDLWHPYLGGEKPMELAFLNSILRSPFMPPLDPWFSGGYINYYYYGYVIIGSLIKLTSIVPTIAFNLAIPTLFAMTFSSAVLLVYNFVRRLPVALLGGYFCVIIGNFDAFTQLKDQVLALLTHAPVPTFSYWQSSRVIPFTINEFPFWSFLFADLHPHVIDMPIALCMLTLLAAFVLPSTDTPATHKKQLGSYWLYLLVFFSFGTIACVNPWDMPVYAALLIIILLARAYLLCSQATIRELLVTLSLRLVLACLLCLLGDLCYWPFYATFQELYINGLGLVPQGSGLVDYLVVFGFWIFLTLSFLLVELYLHRSYLSRCLSPIWYRGGYALGCVSILPISLFLGVRALLVFLLIVGMAMLTLYLKRSKGCMLEHSLWRQAPKAGSYTSVLTASVLFTYIMLLMGVGICLGTELVYIRDFLDGGSYARMNTVFKFSIQAWFCLAIGGALAVYRLWCVLRGSARTVWMIAFVICLLCCSLFPFEGTPARINDHQIWANLRTTHTSQDYTPTVDSFALVRTWYPGDAKAITWLNEHVSGSPVILEANVPVSYQWYGRVSVYTGLPDVLGWLDHENEQRYNQQSLNRISDIEMMYTSVDPAQTLELLYFYHVRYIYVGPLERQLYAGYPPASLAKFDQMAGSALREVYSSAGVDIYEVL